MSAFLVLMYGWAAYAFAQMSREAFNHKDGEGVGWVLLVLSALNAALLFTEIL